MQPGWQLDDQAFRALAHRDRRRLLTLLVGGERSVGDLSSSAGLDQPIASQQLKVLRDAGLVTVRVEGNRRLYSVEFERVGRLRAFLDGFWRTKLGDLARAAARREGPTGRSEVVP